MSEAALLKLGSVTSMITLCKIEQIPSCENNFTLFSDSGRNALFRSVGHFVFTQSPTHPWHDCLLPPNYFHGPSHRILEYFFPFCYIQDWAATRYNYTLYCFHYWVAVQEIVLNRALMLKGASWNRAIVLKGSSMIERNSHLAGSDQ